MKKLNLKLCFCLFLFFQTFGFAVEPQFSAYSSELVLFRTNFGDLVFAFFPKEAPKHTQQLLKLMKAGVYDLTYFYRLEKGFVLQLANATDRTVPLAESQLKLIHKIPAEFNSLKHVRGVLSMARYDNDENSAETSFSILLNPAPHLDNKYTVFGALVDGYDVLAQIEKIPTEQSKPLARVEVESATVLSVSAYKALKKQGKLQGPKPLPLNLVSATSVDLSKKEPKTRLNLIFIGFCLMLFILGLVIFLGAKTISTSSIRALGLTISLISFFGIFTVVFPFAQMYPLIAGFLFIALVLMFRLLALYESKH